MPVYSDFDFNFIKNISISNDIETKVDNSSITQSIINILLTQKGSVPFDPLFGSGIRNLLFEKMTKITELMLKEEIMIAMENFEPRIKVNLIELTPDYDRNQYEVFMEYTIIYLDSVESMNLDIQLQGI